jgi:hypothetical protein
MSWIVSVAEYDTPCFVCRTQAEADALCLRYNQWVDGLPCDSGEFPQGQVYEPQPPFLPGTMWVIPAFLAYLYSGKRAFSVEVPDWNPDVK